MSERQFQRGKSFAEVSRALTDPKADTTERSILHHAEAHPSQAAAEHAPAEDESVEHTDESE